ncbi:transposase [Nocardia terpenica]|uniref:Transposase n=2 Tax=Nocardia terpenica TaxID=455432 RepID=A0A164IXZ4_9NOCA|nr:transposase [Nocardia terpenica]NQE91200.1 IS1182 family transposase [Nocardia terpenica]
MLIRDRLSELIGDEEFLSWYPTDGRPSLSPAQLMLVSILQFAENLSDRQAADAVRLRLDWKYALGLELEDAVFDYSVLSEFRARLGEHDRADRLLQVMLARLIGAGLLEGRGQQPTDATHVLAAVRRLSRLELAGESVRAALQELAEADPDWLAPLVEPRWAKQYGRKVEIGKVPGGRSGIIDLAETIGRNGLKLLTAVGTATAPPRLRDLPKVKILRRVWMHQYYWDPEGQLRWCEGTALPPASLRFDSPYDPDAHYCVKRDTAWSGYRTHFTETCDEDLPHVVTHVATTIAPVQDGVLTETIHDDLAAQQLAPAEHIVNTAYITPARMERAQRVHGIKLLGPIPTDHSPQAKRGTGFDKSAFDVDFDQHTATCPQGTTSRQWTPTRINDSDYILVKFPTKTCRDCPQRAQCTTAVSGPRSLALLPHPLHEIQIQARAEQATDEWKQRYAVRAGAESTISQNVRISGPRRSRYRGPRAGVGSARDRRLRG